MYGNTFVSIEVTQWEGVEFRARHKPAPLRNRTPAAPHRNHAGPDSLPSARHASGWWWQELSYPKTTQKPSCPRTI